MVEARVRRLPGYVERVELTRQKGPAFRLRQYASRVWCDMQPPEQVGAHMLGSSVSCSAGMSGHCNWWFLWVSYFRFEVPHEL